MRSDSLCVGSLSVDRQHVPQESLQPNRERVKRLKVPHVQRIVRPPSALSGVGCSLIKCLQGSVPATGCRP